MVQGRGGVWLVVLRVFGFDLGGGVSGVSGVSIAVQADG